MRLPALPQNAKVMIAREPFKHALAGLTSIALLSVAPQTQPAFAADSTALLSPPTTNRQAVRPAANPLAHQPISASPRGAVRRRKQQDDAVFPTQHAVAVPCAEPPPLITASAAVETVNQAIDLSDPRNSGSRIVDAARLMDTSARQDVGREISDIESGITRSQILVVTIDDVPAGTTPKKFATDLFNKWKVGSPSRPQAVLVLVVKNARRVEIEVSRSLDGLFDQSWCHAMLKAEVVPLFKHGLYADGVLEGVRRIGGRLHGGGQDYETGEAKGGAPGSVVVGTLLLALMGGSGGGGGGGEGSYSSGGGAGYDSSGDGGGGADW